MTMNVVKSMLSITLKLGDSTIEIVPYYVA